MMRFVWLGAFIGVACGGQPEVVRKPIAAGCDAGACPIPDTAGGLSVTLGAAEALTHAVMSGEDAGTCDADSR